jgi:hypothetical protein
MDKATMMLELTGLSRVLDKATKLLALKLEAVQQLAEAYEQTNPFHDQFYDLEVELQQQIEVSAHKHLSNEEARAFFAQWYKMDVYQQTRLIKRYLEECGP